MKNVKRIFGIIMVSLAIALLMSVNCYAANNGAGNEANHGFAVSDGTYIYYSADGNLYRENIGGGGRKTLVEESSAISSIVIDGDYIYYFRGQAIQRVRKDGSDKEFVTYAGGIALPPITYIKNGNMYYRGTSTIYKRNTNSGNEEQIAESYEAFVLSGNKIYFSNNSSRAGATGLASIDLDGGSFKSYGVGTAVSINVYDGNIYYMQDNKIWKISTNGGDAKSLCSASTSYINVYNGYVYFRDNGKLTRISVNGGEKETSNLSVNSIICICEGKVYGRSTDGYSDVEVDDIPEFKTSSSGSSSSNSSSDSSSGKKSNNATSKKKDVSEIFIYSDWAENEIQEAYDNGLISEYFEGKDLTKEITREEFAAIAVRIYETVTNNHAPIRSHPFKDLGNSKLKQEICQAYNANITVGVSKTEFAPNAKLNREQLATMLCRVIKKYKFPEWTIDNDGDYHMSGASGKKFADDADISDYAKDSVYFMSSVGIVQGIGNNKFAPKNTTTWEEAQGYANATREQAIVISNRIYKTKDMY